MIEKLRAFCDGYFVGGFLIGLGLNIIFDKAKADALAQAAIKEAENIKNGDGI